MFLVRGFVFTHETGKCQNSEHDMESSRKVGKPLPKISEEWGNESIVSPLCGFSGDIFLQSPHLVLSSDTSVCDSSNVYVGAFLHPQKSTSPNTWLRLRDYKAGALIEEYSTSGEYLPHVGYTPNIYWLRLSSFGEQFYRDNWQRYRELYPEVDAPAPEQEINEDNKR
jgi:hypothetical protein